MLTIVDHPVLCADFSLSVAVYLKDRWSRSMNILYFLILIPVGVGPWWLGTACLSCDYDLVHREYSSSCFSR